MRRLLSLTLILALLSLPACTPAAQEPAEEGYGLWFAVRQDGGRALSSAVAREDRLWTSEPDARTLLEALLAGPETAGLYAPFPSGVDVISITLDAGDQSMKVNLTEQYGGLAGFDLTMADYCITLTLTQLPGVEAVEVLVDGQTIPYRDRQVMQTGDVLLAGGAEEPDTFLAALHFPRADGEGLAVEYRQVKRSAEDAAGTVMVELLRGPTDAEGHLPLPLDTQVIGLTVSDGLCRADLSAGFLTNAPQDDDQATLALYALVNTLCALGGISQVEVLVEGEAIQSYSGVSISGPLSPNFALSD